MLKEKQSGNKSNLLHWCIWFFVGNAVLFWLIGLGYFSTIWSTISLVSASYGLAHTKLVISLFTTAAYIGYLGLLALIPCLIVYPLAVFFPRRKLIFSLAVTIASIIAMLLVIDAFTYKLYRFHLCGPIAEIALHGFGKNVFGFSFVEYLITFLLIGSVFVFESIYAILVWKYVVKKNILRGHFKWFIMFLFLCWYLAFEMLVSSSGYAMNRLLRDSANFLPLYVDSLKVFAANEFDEVGNANLIKVNQTDAPLNYPTQPLQCQTAKKPLNLVLVVIDTWRADMLNKAVTPNLVEFANKAWTFNHHFSGGNATGPGIFSLFYGLPATYWTAFEDQQRGPVFIDELLKQHYQMGIFASATLHMPSFDKNVFADFKNLIDTPGATPYVRDRAITQDFKKFIDEAVKKPEPFFSFIFYDSVHSFCAFDEDLQPRKPVIESCNRIGSITERLPYINRYENALSLVDQEIAQVIATLKSHRLLDNTVVIVTGDHGDEFNDNQLGYWGHASNFTHYQVQTPLVVYWPHQSAHVFSYQTSHFDIVPTLMKRLLGCNTPSSTYGVGKSLFDSKSLPYLIVGSYVSTGIIEPNQIDDFSPSGNLCIKNLSDRPMLAAKLHLSVMQQAYHDAARFYKR